MSVGHKFGTGIRVCGLPIQVKQAHRLIPKGARQPECMLDQLRCVQPDVTVRRIDQAQHLTEISLFAPLIADLFGIGGGE